MRILSLAHGRLEKAELFWSSGVLAFGAHTLLGGWTVQISPGLPDGASVVSVFFGSYYKTPVQVDGAEA